MSGDSEWIDCPGEDSCAQDYEVGCIHSHWEPVLGVCLVQHL